VATTAGAIIGASVATRLPGTTIEVVFGVVLLVSVYLTLAIRLVVLFIGLTGHAL